ncbi:uncharacterized protein BDZ99DRAFT_414977 [Mytilinidion resinicola]|uniref:AB hydrolase-1 domain-containing protein n=1 Tax=Mytilinidion resinicola TaxID=574789 RepID=A0A6A6YPG5_9PEZI|nr:uncharacterized protein BDZ99DRAFT_414977 [Mytilinidion resinicola]KAF2810786.1 hypothetical protein BDZ99DRAFT_414977 [Mytilinidion resinicola]
MIGTSTPEYVFIRASIAGLRAITPLSVLYCGFCIVRPPRSIVGKVLVAWAAIETAFYFLVYLPRKHILQKAADHPEPLDPEHRKVLFQRCFSTIPDAELYLSKWFLGSPLEDIKRENIKDFFRWAFLNTADYDPADDEELETYITGVENLLGRKIEPGRGPAKCLRLTIDEVDMMHRSFLWYCIVGLVDGATAVHFKFRGFSLYRTSLRRFFDVFPLRPFTLLCTHHSPAEHTSYWYRPHTSKTKLPVLFIHGIGIGLYPYVQFVAEINQSDDYDSSDGDVGIIAVEIMPICMRITPAALAKEAMCMEINSILEKHGWNKFVLVSHSYGTVISTHLLQNPIVAPKIGPILLIDPVTFLLHLPDVAYNFTARKPSTANEHQLYYLASKDMGVAHTLSRHFFWNENILWLEDIVDHNVTVSLSGRDLIVNTEAVGRYLVGASSDGSASGWSDDDGGWKQEPWIGEGLDVLWWPQADHAQVFDMVRARKKLVKVVKKYVRNGKGSNGTAYGSIQG